MYQGNHERAYIGSVIPEVRGRHGDECYLEIRNFLVLIMASMPRFGKTQLCMDLIAKISHGCYQSLNFSNFRRILVFDIRDEWKNKITKKNYRSETPMSLREPIKFLKNLKVKISDMKADDWAYLGFSGRSIDILNELRKHFPLYKDNPEEFAALLQELPTEYRSLKSWNARYGEYYYMPSSIHSSVYDSINTVFSSFLRRKTFYNDEDQDETGKPLESMVHLLYNNNIIVSLDIMDKNMTGIIIGKILEDISQQNCYYLNRLKPLIVFEEADIFCGLPSEGGMYPYKSCEKAVEYVLKLQKFSSSCIFITQACKLLHPDIIKQASQFILGEVPPYDPYYELVKKYVSSRYNLDKGQRYFIYIDKIKGEYVPFEAGESVCKT